MRNNSLISKIVFLTGVLLLGALFVSNYSRWFGYPKNAISKGVAQAQEGSGQSVNVSKPVDPERRIIDDSPSNLNPDEQKKWAALRDIMRTKNDNDPRLDTELRDLSSVFHSELMRQYQALPMESRNERGLISFLIARDIKDAQDMEFLKSLYDENPCLSLEDCASPSHSDPHLSGLDQTSSNYPQLAALYQIEKQLNSGNKIFEDNNFKDLLRQMLSHASQFPVPIVQKKADAIRSSHSL